MIACKCGRFISHGMATEYEAPAIVPTVGVQFLPGSKDGDT